MNTSPERGAPDAEPEKLLSEKDEAFALSDWIEEELGDEELALFLREHPEGAELLANGGHLLPRTTFELLDDLDVVDGEKAWEFLRALDANGSLPKTSFDRVVGSTAQEEAGDIFLGFRHRLGKSRLESGDVDAGMEKSDLASIHAANEGLSQLRARYGLPSIHVPPEAVKLLSDAHDKFDTESRENVGGMFYLVDQTAYLKEEETPEVRSPHIFHELTHFHSYGSVQLDRMPDGHNQGRAYRIGLSVIPRQHGVKFESGAEQHISDEPYLQLLNEAVTEETANRLYLDTPTDHPELGAFVLRRRELAEKITERLPHVLERDGTRASWYSSATPCEDGGVKLRSSYPDERKMMFRMLAKIAKQNPELFAGKTAEESEDELFSMLQRAMFSGNILPFGRLFNHTFGRGAFREFGHLQTLEEQEAFIIER